jgi:hypothetical protein
VLVTIDVSLLLLVVIAAVAIAGLVLALQTAGGRRRLADGGLRLAEALIALAVRWLERNVPAGGAAATMEAPPAEAYTLACALGALGSLAGRREVLTK